MINTTIPEPLAELGRLREDLVGGQELIKPLKEVLEVLGYVKKLEALQQAIAMFWEGAAIARKRGADNKADYFCRIADALEALAPEEDACPTCE